LRERIKLEAVSGATSAEATYTFDENEDDPVSCQACTVIASEDPPVQPISERNATSGVLFTHWETLSGSNQNCLSRVSGFGDP